MPSKGVDVTRSRLLHVLSRFERPLRWIGHVRAHTSLFWKEGLWLKLRTKYRVAARHITCATHDHSCVVSNIRFHGAAGA